MTPRSFSHLTFREHLEELRSRLFWSVMALLSGAGIGYIFYKQLLYVLLTPLHQPIYYSSPAGGVDFMFKICLFFGTIFALPVWIYNLIKFVEPAFSKKIQGLLWKVILGSYLLMLTGMSFAYFINLPILLHFFSSFSTQQIHSLISTDQYLSFVITDLFGFGFVFQMPLILLIFYIMHPFPLRFLLKQEKYIIVFSFLIGAILTPDPLNQIIMAIPIIILYQLSIVLIFLKNLYG